MLLVDADPQFHTTYPAANVNIFKHRAFKLQINNALIYIIVTMYGSLFPSGKNNNNTNNTKVIAR